MPRSNYNPPLPPVLKGIPIPVVKRRKSSRKGEKRESPWCDYLRALQPGDCFDTDYFTCQHTKSQAKKLDMDIVSTPHGTYIYGRRVDGSYRVWCVSAWDKDRFPAPPVKDSFDPMI